MSTKKTTKQPIRRSSLTAQKTATRNLRQSRKKSSKLISERVSSKKITKTKHLARGFLVGTIICGIITSIIVFPKLLSNLNSSYMGVGSAEFMAFGVILPSSLFIILGILFVILAWIMYVRLCVLKSHSWTILFWSIFASVLIIAPLVFISCYDSIHRAHIDKAKAIGDSSPQDGINDYLNKKYNLNENFKISNGRCPSGDLVGTCTYDVNTPSVYGTFHVTASRLTIYDKWTYDDKNSYGLQRYNRETEDYYMKIFTDHSITVGDHRVTSYACKELDVSKSFEGIRNDNSILFVVSVNIPVAIDPNKEKEDIYSGAEYVNLYRSASEPARRIFEQYRSENTILEVNARINDKATVPWSRFGETITYQKRHQLPCDEKYQIEAR